MRRREKSPNVLAPQPAVTLVTTGTWKEKVCSRSVQVVCPPCRNSFSVELAESLRGAGPRRHCTLNQCLQAIGSLW